MQWTLQLIISVTDVKLGGGVLRKLTQIVIQYVVLFVCTCYSTVDSIIFMSTKFGKFVYSACYIWDHLMFKMTFGYTKVYAVLQFLILAN